jgi:hypothetical protein
MTFSEFLNELQYLFIHSCSCFSVPSNTPMCFKFWAFFYSISFLITFYVFIRILRKILKDRSDWNKYLLKVAKREAIADSETMSKSVWRGDFEATK